MQLRVVDSGSAIEHCVYSNGQSVLLRVAIPRGEHEAIE